MKNHYEVLGVQKDATDSEIRKAYYRLAREWHPDKNKSPDAEEMFKKIGGANEILSDPNKRSAYDSELDQEMNEEFNNFNSYRSRESSSFYANKQDEELKKTMDAFNKFMESYTKEMERQHELGQQLVVKAYEGKWNEVVALIKQGADINVHLSSRLIFEQHIELSASHFKDATALHIALLTNNNEAAKTLIDCGANVNDSNYSLWCPLHIVAENNNLNMAILLRKKGAYPHFTTKNTESTALHVAISRRSKEVALYLIDNPSDTRNPFTTKISSNNRKTKSGKAPIDRLINLAQEDKSWWPVANKLLARPEVRVDFNKHVDLLKDFRIPDETKFLAKNKYNEMEERIKSQRSSCAVM